jgi:hypothetical protein
MVNSELLMVKSKSVTAYCLPFIIQSVFGLHRSVLQGKRIKNSILIDIGVRLRIQLNGQAVEWSNG